MKDGQSLQLVALTQCTSTSDRALVFRGIIRFRDGQVSLERSGSGEPILLPATWLEAAHPPSRKIVGLIGPSDFVAVVQVPNALKSSADLTIEDQTAITAFKVLLRDRTDGPAAVRSGVMLGFFNGLKVVTLVVVVLAVVTALRFEGRCAFVGRNFDPNGQHVCSFADYAVFEILLGSLGLVFSYYPFVLMIVAASTFIGWLRNR